VRTYFLNVTIEDKKLGPAHLSVLMYIEDAVACKYFCGTDIFFSQENSEWKFSDTSLLPKDPVATEKTAR
jgi:hypothetical protein